MRSVPRLTEDAVIQRLTDLPPLPDLCFRMGELVEDPRSTARHVVDLISTDAAAASRVLRVANSSFYGVTGGVDSIEKAVRYIGFSATYQIVVCLTSYGMLRDARGRLPPWLNAHALAVAALTQRIAAQCGIPAGQMGLAAGLLHDIGRHAIFSLFPDYAEVLVHAARGGACHGVALEQEIVGIDHARMGALLAARWRYPPALLEAIRDHHGPGPIDATGPLLSDAVALADAWAWELGRPGFMHAREWERVAADRCARLSLPASAPKEASQAIANTGALM
jgi:putative nucleotidyltransferase with HDIG domain